MSYYRLYVENEKTEHVVEGKSPAKALRELVEKAGLLLVEQDGRYGKAHTPNGRGNWNYKAVSVAALTEAWSRRKLDPEERTTRLLPGERR